ncbi:hypothetical protein, conserved [Babesia bigemina]|uniref:CS domain-containing protein n=1 Tax=Babesia bigemina TaxID=5866 RepID=A0A061D8S6_BABBI|nr:hypothetical protein, conserved [Babesia bigemina]CDR97116.1 hypothetical protein, conserved [Babesia bigemina]|eukprot:XP_012769302.1 hypothetical protein, conserved [Babesia bigemina]
MALSPNVFWAQTKDAVYMTVEVEHNKDTHIDIKDEALAIKAKKDGKDYECVINFYKPIKSSEVMKADERFLRFKLPKADEEKWPTLNNDGKKHWLKIDWDRWVDSDAEDDDAARDNFDMGNFGNFGDFAGMNPGAFDDDDDDYMGDDSDFDKKGDCCSIGDCACDKCECGSVCKCSAKCKCEACPCEVDCDCDAECMNASGCCSKGDCACDKCECGSICKCGTSCSCGDCPCDAECDCGAKCLTTGGCCGKAESDRKCCENCTCGSDCACTPENMCAANCKCGVASA